MSADSWAIWKNSKQWVSTNFKRVFTANNFQQQPLVIEQKYKPKEMHTEKDEKKMKFLAQLRGENIEDRLNKRLHKINKYFSRNQQYEKPLELACPICLDLYNLPVTTACGHTFCLQCLDQSLLFASGCPVCRTNIRGSKLIKCENLADIALRFTSKYHQSHQRQQYLSNLNKSNDWQTNRNINKYKISVDQAVDARDTQFIWCEASIRQIYKKNGQNHSVLIHYKGWNNIYNEIIEISSYRLAQHKFYTSRMDIPRYRMDQKNKQSMHNFVIIGADQPNFDFPSIYQHFAHELLDNFDYIQEQQLQNDEISLSELHAQQPAEDDIDIDIVDNEADEQLDSNITYQIDFDELYSNAGDNPEIVTGTDKNSLNLQ